MALTVTEIQQLYTAYLGRPADREGLEYWQETDLSAAEVRTFLASDEQPEYVELYGDRSREELVQAIYENMFGREADEEGLEYWVNGDGAAVPASELQQLFIEAASQEDREAFDAQVTADVSEIPPVTDPEEPSDTINVDFANTASAGGDGSFVVNDSGLLEFVANSDDVEGYIASGNGTGGTTVRDIGKIEWDEAGQVVTSSKDYTFNLADQLGAGEQYNGLFLSPVLTSENRSQNSQLFIDLLDLRQPADSTQPLGDLPVNGFAFSVDGERVILQSEEIFEAKSYNELLTAVSNALNESEEPLLEGFSAELAGDFTVKNQDGDDVSGRTLVLTDANGRTLEEGNFTNSDDATTGGFTLYGEQSTEAPENIQALIETNLDLDNIGYGSQGGSINLVGQSNSDKGIEQMNVSADNTVWLTRLESNGAQQFLKEINLEGEGAFHVGQQDGDSVFGLSQLLGSSTNAYGLVDVQDINGGNYNGNIKLNAIITDSVVGRDLNAMDDDTDPKSDNATFNYTTAAGDDQVSLALSDELMAREDASVVINSGAGDDVVETVITNTDFDFFDDADLSDQQLNANLNIATGEGNDVVRTWGAGDADISTGAGDDVVYADNSGILTSRDRWEFNSTAAAGFAPTDVSNSDVALSDTANDVDQTFSVDEDAEIQVRVTFKGHQSVFVDVPSTDGGDSGDTISTLQVNQAIKDAVNNDRVLSNLLEAFDGDGNILNIESLIDGNNLDALDITFRDNNDDTSSTSGLADMDAIYGEAVGGGAEVAANIAGTNSDAESDNTIDVGTGNDVVVLGTGAESNDTLVLAENFGTNDIVNFTAGDVSGSDILDFTSYGVNSASVGSADYDVANDEVNVVSFNASDFDADTTFGNLNAADISDAIGDTVDEGRVDSIVMVESGNAGLYKVFDVNSANNDDSYTVDYVGILDFGDSLTGLVDGNIA